MKCEKCHRIIKTGAAYPCGDLKITCKSCYIAWLGSGKNASSFDTAKCGGDGLGRYEKIEARRKMVKYLLTGFLRQTKPVSSEQFAARVRELGIFATASIIESDLEHIGRSVKDGELVR